MIRTPKFVNLFYEKDKELLIRQIESCIKSEFGPGTLKSNSNAKAIISPHAGLIYSGPCALHSYAQITKPANTYIILGTNHSSSTTCLSNQDFQTPLGIVKNNQSITNQLKKYIPINNQNHEQEHSIEVQLPILQYINSKERNKNFNIVPILIGTDYKTIIEPLKKIITNPKIKIICSADFTHQGNHFNYKPFKIDNKIKNNIKKLDFEIIDDILENNPKKINERINSKTYTICGIYPILLTLNLIESKGTLQKYYTSSDIENKDTQNYNHSVSYASINFN